MNTWKNKTLQFQIFLVDTKHLVPITKGFFFTVSIVIGDAWVPYSFVLFLHTVLPLQQAQPSLQTFHTSSLISVPPSSALFSPYFLFTSCKGGRKLCCRAGQEGAQQLNDVSDLNQAIKFHDTQPVAPSISAKITQLVQKIGHVAKEIDIHCNPISKAAWLIWSWFYFLFLIISFQLCRYSFQAYVLPSWKSKCSDKIYLCLLFHPIFVNIFLSAKIHSCRCSTGFHQCHSLLLAVCDLPI